MRPRYGVEKSYMCAFFFLFAGTSHLFPDIDNNPEPPYTYLLKPGAAASTPNFEYQKYMLPTDGSVIEVDGPFGKFNVSKYTHEAADGSWSHAKAAYCYPDNVYPALVAKSLGVGIQYVPYFVTVNGNPEWFFSTHLLAEGLVDMVGNKITPKMGRNFAWEALTLPAHIFANNQVVIQKSYLEACNATTYFEGSAIYEDTKANREATTANCMDGAPLVLGAAGTTCYQIWGDLCASAGIAKNPVGTEDILSYCTTAEAVGLASGSASVTRARERCPERFTNTVTYTMNRDLLATAVYPDAHLYAFAKGTIDLLKYAYANNKGKHDCDLEMPSTSDNYLLTTYPSGKQLVMHGNALVCMYGNMKDVYELMGRNMDDDLPVLYDEFFR